MWNNKTILILPARKLSVYMNITLCYFWFEALYRRDGGSLDRRGHAEHPQDARTCHPAGSQSRCRERHGPARTPERVQERKPVAVSPAGRGAVYRAGEEAGAPGVTRTPGQRFRKPLLCPPELRGRIVHRGLIPRTEAAKIPSALSGDRVPAAR